MVSHLFFYQLTLIALVWLCVMLHWAWPSDSAAACPTPPEPPPPRPKRHRAPKPFAGLTTKPHCDACEHATAPRPQPPQLRHRASCPRGGAAARSTPRRISARTRTVPIGAGSAGAISAPMAIPMAVPGGSCCVSSVAAIFSRPSARSFMASAPPSSSSCASSRAWPKAWASGARRGCSRSTPIRCCSGWSRRRSSCRPFPGTSCTTCGSGRCSWMSCLPCSVRSRTARSARPRPSSAWSGRPSGSGWRWTPRASCCWRSTSGDRTLAMAQRVVHHVAQVLAPDCAPLFLTDGFREYLTALLTHYGHWVQPPRRQATRPRAQAALDATARSCSMRRWSRPCGAGVWSA